MKSPSPKPARDYGAGRTMRLHLRVTPEEHAAYVDAAARCGLSVAEGMRQAFAAQSREALARARAHAFGEVAEELRQQATQCRLDGKHEAAAELTEAAARVAHR